LDSTSQIYILKPKPLSHVGGNIRLIFQIVSKFFIYLAIALKKWICEDFQVAHELSITIPRASIVLPRRPGYPPPWEEIGDICLWRDGRHIS
jgi:hypothetical protein